MVEIRKMVLWLAYCSLRQRIPSSTSDKQPLDIARVRKVLILYKDKIDDMIITAAPLHELKKNYPHWQIDMAASSANLRTGNYR